VTTRAGDERDGPDGPDGQVLAGGMANAGGVVRFGDAVERPAAPHSAALHAHLARLAAHGFTGAPRPLGLSADGRRERLTFLPGDVPLPPFPAWALTEEALRSVGALLRRMHDAAAAGPPPDPAVRWPADLADPEGGPLLCHNDVCPENTVFRGGRAAALIDFDLAAPGRPVWDVAMAARYWAPMLDPESAGGAGLGGLAGQDPLRRLRLLADAYGLAGDDRAALPDVVARATEVGRAFVAARVAAGDPVYVRAFTANGGWARWDRLLRWQAEHRAAAVRALLAP
jgi:hypothetical protein